MNKQNTLALSLLGIGLIINSLVDLGKGSQIDKLDERVGHAEEWIARLDADIVGLRQSVVTLNEKIDVTAAMVKDVGSSLSKAIVDLSGASLIHTNHIKTIEDSLIWLGGFLRDKGILTNP